MDSPSPKILLTNTSTMSLHDRFTNLITNNQADLTDLSGAMLHAASMKNQRLAHQMANRPSVLAALRSKSCLRQRLGLGNMKARLGRPAVKGVLYGMPKCSSRPRGRGALLGASVPMRLPQDVLMQPQNGIYEKSAGVVHSRGMSTLGGNGGMRRTLRGKGRAQSSGVHGVFIGRGWPGGRFKADSRPLPTREELDKQLDDYMSMTKSYLDAQLDEYMAEVDTEGLL